MRIILIFLTTTLLFPSFLSGQIAFWQKYIGGTHYDAGQRIICRPDGSLIVAGKVLSQDGHVDANHSENADVFIARFATQGNFFWKSIIGGSGEESLEEFIETRDGGYLLVGSSNSSDGDISQNKGGNDVWIAKLDIRGNIEWSKTFGGSGDDRGTAVIQLPDGGYLLGGESSSTNGDMQSQHHGGLDSWIAKLTSKGRILWEKHYGGSGNEKVSRIHQLGEEEFLILNSSDSRDFQVAGNLGKKDAWLFKIDYQGELTWQMNIGGEDNDDLHGSMVDSDGNIVISGTSFSKTGIMLSQAGKGDCWLFKLNPAGAILWSRTYGGPKSDGANTIREGLDGNYLLCGITRSHMGDIPRNSGYYDGWFAKLDRNGEPLWSRTIGYGGKDALVDIMELSVGGYLGVGFSQFSPADNLQAGHKGLYDMWVVNFGDPQKGMNVRPYKTPPVLTGTVTDVHNGQGLESEIILSNTRTLDSLNSTFSDLDSGKFYTLLPSYGLVSINVQSKGYLFYGQDVSMDTIIDKTMISREIKLEPIQIGSSLILKNINFNTGKWDLLSSSYPELERVVDFLNLNPRVVIQVSGHTDNTGNKAQKVELSNRRALAVKDYLVEQGINPNRLKVKGYGMYRPIATNKTEAGRKKNRRVEFEVLVK
ncbi:MAG: OmpA family protein [Bacteroidia bacterium]|nr:OmpA family protein [Bacteroidia bacterium]